MPEYIEREAAINAVVGLTVYEDAPSLNAAVEREYHNGREWIGGVRDAIVELADLPAADVVEVRHGKWINAYPEIEPNPMFMYGICSVCGFEQSVSDKLKYCPDCGAKMDGGQNDV